MCMMSTNITLSYGILAVRLKFQKLDFPTGGSSYSEEMLSIACGMLI